MRHIKKLLVLAALGLLIFLGISTDQAHQQKLAASREKLEAGALLLDVRTPQEYRAGHIEGAINLPVQQLSLRIDELRDWRDQDIIIYCQSGARSREATALLRRAGFSKLQDVGAMSNLSP